MAGLEVAQAGVEGVADGLVLLSRLQEFAAVAFNKDGKISGEIAHNYTPVIPGAQLASVKKDGVDFRNALDLAPGKYTVRFVIRDNVTGKVGSVTAPLTVN